MSSSASKEDETGSVDMEYQDAANKRKRMMKLDPVSLWKVSNIIRNANFYFYVNLLDWTMSTALRHCEESQEGGRNSLMWAIYQSSQTETGTPILRGMNDSNAIYALRLL